MRWAARLGRVQRPAAARACWAGNSWRATAPLAGLLGWRCCWVGLEDRIGVDGLGIKVWVLKRIQTIEFKFEFEFQQTKEMHQHECNI
jgi:hypothetical protein